MRCPWCGLGEARDLLRIHPDGVNNSILYEPKPSASLDRALGLKIRVRHALLTAHSTTQGLRVVVPLPKHRPPVALTTRRAVTSACTCGSKTNTG